MSNYSALVDLIIKNEMNGIPVHEIVIELGETPELLLKHADFPMLPLVIKASTIAKICFEHGIATTHIKKIKELLFNPKAIYRSATQQGVIVLTVELKGEHPIIIPVHPNKTIGRNKYNVIASMYAKEGNNPEITWKKSGLLLFST
ncbi:hypothetical protein [Lonepinella sp. BR2271]|uniref:MuF-C-terminal domain-containing protein n=1 Tax=Lonepinella sp. BR2271 TaxID=3434550 RepID=UPI003F6DD9AE